MTYNFSYDGSSRPKWEKVFTASSGETFSAELHFQNQTDRNMLTEEQVFGYLELLLQYAKDCLAPAGIITMSDPPAKTFYPLKGGDYNEFEWAMETLNEWWQWAYYNDNFGEPNMPTDEPA